jgi:hypothetical protein
MTGPKKMVSPEHVLSDDHPGHAGHMCELVGKRQMATVARLAANARYLCHICGRAAADAKNLCEPVEI